MIRSRPLLVAVAVAIAAALAGCSSSSSPESTSSGATTTAGTPTTAGAPTTAATTTPTTAGAAATGTAITIKSFTFQPDQLQAKVGDTITVTNGDGTNHSLTAVDGSFDTGFFSGGTKTFTVTKAGRFEFKCNVHSFMPHGFIQVS